MPVTRLRAMFLSLGVLVSGGVTYGLYVLKAEYSVADAVDAGLLQVSVPARLSCRVRILEECRQGANASRPKYARVGLKARILPTDGPDSIVFDVPDAWRPCVRFLGTPDEACDIVENGSCTLPAVCAAGADPQVEVQACACRADAGVCVRPDGGTVPFGATMQPGEWRTDGGGCQRKYCGPEIAGEQGQSMPGTCP